MDRKESLELGIFTSGVVKLRLGLTGLTKENWTQELLAAILLGILSILGISSFMIPLRDHFLRLKCQISWECWVWKKDNIKKVVFEEELFSLPNVGMDDVQAGILDFTMKLIIEQDNNEVPIESEI